MRAWLRQILVVALVSAIAVPRPLFSQADAQASSDKDMTAAQESASKNEHPLDEWLLMFLKGGITGFIMGLVYSIPTAAMEYRDASRKMKSEDEAVRKVRELYLNLLELRSVLEKAAERARRNDFALRRLRSALMERRIKAHEGIPYSEWEEGPGQEFLGNPRGTAWKNAFERFSSPMREAGAAHDEMAEKMSLHGVGNPSLLGKYDAVEGFLTYEPGSYTRSRVGWREIPGRSKQMVRDCQFKMRSLVGGRAKLAGEVGIPPDAGYFRRRLSFALNSRHPRMSYIFMGLAGASALGHRYLDNRIGAQLRIEEQSQSELVLQMSAHPERVLPFFVIARDAINHANDDIMKVIEAVIEDPELVTEEEREKFDWDFIKTAYQSAQGDTKFSSTMIGVYIDAMTAAAKAENISTLPLLEDFLAQAKTNESLRKTKYQLFVNNFLHALFDRMWGLPISTGVPNSELFDGKPFYKNLVEDITLRTVNKLEVKKPTEDIPPYSGQVPAVDPKAATSEQIKATSSAEPVSQPGATQKVPVSVGPQPISPSASLVTISGI